MTIAFQSRVSQEPRPAGLAGKHLRQFIVLSSGLI